MGHVNNMEMLTSQSYGKIIRATARAALLCIQKKIINIIITVVMCLYSI